MSEVNLDRLRELSGHLRDAVRQLRELAQSSREVFVADSRSTVNSAKYLLIVAAEAALDICNHLAARRAARRAEPGRLRRLHGDQARSASSTTTSERDSCGWRDSGTCSSISMPAWTTVR